MVNDLSSSPVISLLGHEEENFYELGRGDTHGFLLVQQSLKRNLGNIPSLNKILHRLIEQTAATLFNNHGQLKRNLYAYAEGMELPLEKVCGTFILPEILSASSFFMPNFMKTLMGCSSLFFMESKDTGISHFRVLDYPLIDAFAQNAQTILMQFPRQKVFFFTTKGMPYPSITAMNESGLTLALHQKPCNLFWPKGVPIFEVAKLIMAEARDRQDLETIIKENPTMTGWGIYSCIGNEVLSIDLLGDQYWIKSHSMEEGKVCYFCNESPNHRAFQNVIPLGLDFFNQMRRESIEEYLAKKLQKTPLNEDIILRGLTKPLGQKGMSAANWRQSPLTINSIDTCILNPKQQSTLRMSGRPPKIFDRGYETYHQCFHRQPIMKAHKKRPEKRLQRYYQGLSYFAQAALSYQKKDIHALFHSLQMAHAYYRGWPEQTIIRFYDVVFQYIFLKSARDEHSLLDDFEKLSGKLPYYLDQQCTLFILRLHKLLNLATTTPTLSHDPLKKIWEREGKLKPAILRAQRFLYNPRPGILDIIYPFSS